MTDWVLLVSRIAVAACVLPSATAHLFNVSGLALAFWMKRMPFSNGVATACALGEMVGAAGLALGLAPRLIAAVLAGSMVITTGTLHRFWDVAGPGRAMDEVVFSGNVAVLAALGFYMVVGPGAWSWQGFWVRPPAAVPDAPKKKPRRKPRAKREVEPEQVAEAA